MDVPFKATHVSGIAENLSPGACERTRDNLEGNETKVGPISVCT